MVLLALLLVNFALIGLVVFLVYRLDKAVEDGARRMMNVIDRVEVTKNLELRPTEPDLMTPSEKRSYISEFEYDDATWNEFVGKPDTDEPDESQ